METRQWNIECFGKRLGEIEVTKDTFQKEIVLTLKIEPSSDLEVRTYSSNLEDVQFTFKEKEVAS